MRQITLKRGDTLDLEFQWLDGDGVPVDLTGCTARLQMRNRAGNEVLECACGSSDGLEIVTAEGKVRWREEASSTSSFSPGTYYFDLEVTFPDNTVRSTETVQLIIETDITR